MNKEQIEALRQWLKPRNELHPIDELCDLALSALRPGEPVAWQVIDEQGKIVATRTARVNAITASHWHSNSFVRPLYAAPADSVTKGDGHE